MRNDFEAPSAELKASYEKLERAIKVFLTETDSAEDYVGDWVLLVAQTVLGDGYDGTTVQLRSAMNQPLYRTKGLMYDMLDVIAESDIVRGIRQD